MGVLMGVLTALLGIFLLKNPLQGIVSLTYAIAVMLFFAGAARLLLAFGVEGGARWFLILSALLSWLFGVMIFGNFAGAAFSLLGVLLAVELISNGVSLIMLALAKKHADKAV